MRRNTYTQFRAGESLSQYFTYFPSDSRERISRNLEKLQYNKSVAIRNGFESFCRVSVRSVNSNLVPWTDRLLYVIAKLYHDSAVVVNCLLAACSW